MPLERKVGLEASGGPAVRGVRRDASTSDKVRAGEVGARRVDVTGDLDASLDHMPGVHVAER